MYSVVSKQIIENWLEQLSAGGEVEPSFIEVITQLAQDSNLKSEEQLKQAISSLEERYENEGQSTDG